MTARFAAGAVVAALFLGLGGPVMAQGRDKAVVIVDGVVREVFKSARQGQVDVILLVDVRRSELGPAEDDTVRLAAPVPGESVYVHTVERPVAGKGTSVPAERSQVRLHLVTRPRGGWELVADGVELTSRTPAPASPNDPPAAATADARPFPQPESGPATAGNRAAIDALGLTAEPMDVRGKFVLKVNSLERGGIGQRAGLEPGDVIAGVNDRELTTLAEFQAILHKGGPLNLSVLDVNTGKGARVGVDLRPSELPPAADGRETAPNPMPAPAKRSLGFSAEPVSLGMRTGMKVIRVDEGGIAQRAGLEPGDVIVAVNDTHVTNVETLSSALRKSGNDLKLIVRDTRTGRDTPVSVSLGGPVEKPSSLPSTSDTTPGTGVRKLGVVGEVVFFDAESAVKVTEVEPGSPAARAGIRAGDIITDANGTPVLHPNTLNEVVAKSTGTLKLITVDPRSGSKKNIDVPLGR